MFEEDPEEEKALDSDEIKSKAIAIAKEGDPIEYLLQQAQRSHIGDLNCQKILLLSIASAASETSNGIHPVVIGRVGGGKSHVCESVFHLIPNDRKVDGSFSRMALFYLNKEGKLKPGTIVFLDDVGHKSIDMIYRHYIKNFQKPMDGYSMGRREKSEITKLSIPSRMIWWETSLKARFNSGDRRYIIRVDSSPAHNEMVSGKISEKRSECHFQVDKNILIARSIIKDIFDNGTFKVVVPQEIRTKWMDNLSLIEIEKYWDMVDALTILQWRQHQMDSEGRLIVKWTDLIEIQKLMDAMDAMETPVI